VGGEFTYTCLGGNRFRIQLTIYQDCLSQTVGEDGRNIDDPASVNIFSNRNNERVIVQDMILVSDTVIGVEFVNNCITNVPETCLKKLVFEAEVTLPPDSEFGYTIAYARCCRTTSIENIIAPGNTSSIYSTTIPPFVDSVCPNNSAAFKNEPPQIICNNYPFIHDFSADDVDGDSLSYSLCNAYHIAELNGSVMNPKPVEFDPPPYDVVSYGFGYSATNPVSALPAFAIDASTGILTGTPIQSGRFIVTVCVSEWRDGQLVTTHSLDIMLLIADCSKATVANTPLFSDQPNTYIVNCTDRTVTFENTSVGADTYEWHFGVPGATSTLSEPTFTYPDTGVYQVKLVVNPGTTCPDSITRLVKIYPGFSADFTYEGKICPQDTIYFSDESIAAHGEVISYDWDFADGNISDIANPINSYDSGGIYSVRLTTRSSIGCVDSVYHDVYVSPLAPYAGNDTILVKDYPYTMKGSGGDNYLWMPDSWLSNGTDPNATANFKDAGIYNYVLQVSNDEGCIGYDTVRIQVINDDIFFLPTAFSPNGDGLNDTFYPVLIGYTRMKFLKVFNRWGEMVFISYEAHRGWDGTFRGQPSETGVYFWQTLVETPWGTEVIKSGDVTLLR